MPGIVYGSPEHLELALKLTRHHFIGAYIEAALWSSNDESTPQGGESLDKKYHVKDIHPDTLEKMRDDCEAFLTKSNMRVFSFQWRKGGHDFWLTRNGHGAGFWDGDWPEPYATRYTELSKSFGEFNLYVDDEGVIRHV